MNDHAPACACVECQVARNSAMTDKPQITVQHYRGGVRLMIGNRVMVTLSDSEAEQLMVDIPAALERAKRDLHE
jgi:hypothetical protein